ncbi:MAG: PEPxxWA-CTERM sorting domain-containing protein [Polymorphobacter sp.]
MSKFRNSSLALGLLLAAPAAQATTVVATLTGFDPAGATVQRTILTGAGAPQVNATQNVGRFYMDRTGGTDTRTLVGSGVPGDFLAFCVEPRELISIGQSALWQVTALRNGASNIGGIGANKAKQVLELFGRFAPNLSTPMSTMQAGALQISIWEIVRETPGSALDVTTGNISFTGGSQAGMLALAQSYVQAIDGTGPLARGMFALRNNGVQDLLAQTAVPEPSTWSMLIAGFGLVGLNARRRRLRSVAA